MPCCNLQYFLCFKKKIKKISSFQGEIPRENSKTIRKKREKYKKNPSVDYLFQALQYENEKMKSIPKLFANRSINHHNNTKNGEQKKSEN